MKEITVLSGKGGTGKTSITAALAAIAKNVVFCDNDVDAADLHLLLQPEIKEKHIFEGAWIPEINPGKCIHCGICIENCRFDAIHPINGNCPEINSIQCEGCRLCERVCPVQAISSKRSDKNYWYVSNTRFGTLVHARMGPGEENSGKLVTQVRKKANEIAKEIDADFIINDGPPGIGCSTIASITGTDGVLIVIEPSQSGLHDAKRLVELVRSFNIPVFAFINKYDINEQVTAIIQDYLEENNLPLLAKIPFDKAMVEAMVAGKTIVEFSPESEISCLVSQAWKKIMNNALLSHV